MILRYLFWPEPTEAQIGGVLDFCRRTGCRELLLFTSSYEYMPSFVPVEQLAEYLGKLKVVKERCAPEGIEVNLDVTQTLGHVYFPVETRKRFGIQPRVSIEGRVSQEGACPLCPNLRKYLREAYRLYAEFGSDLMFVDDDYRYIMGGGLHCFCDLHLSQVGTRLGRRVTLDEARRSILSPEFDNDGVKRACWDVMSNAMIGLAQEIEAVVHDVNPNCKLGVMTALLPSGNFGMDMKRTAETFAGGRHKPFIRPQINMYTETFARDVPSRLLLPALARSFLGEVLDYYPEIENYYYTQFAKSAHMTFLQMLVQYFFGFENLALNITDRFSPAEYSAPITDMLEREKDTFRRVREAVGSRPVIEGVNILNDINRLWHMRVLAGNWQEILKESNFYDYLPNIGLPVGFESEPGFQLLDGDAVLAKTDAELDEILGRGAVINARALECLEHRGRADRIGVETGEFIPLDDGGCEFFTDPDFSQQWHGEAFPIRAAAQPGDFKFLRPSAAALSPRIISEIRNYNMDTVSPAVILTEDSSGARFAVMAAYNTEPRVRRLFENVLKQEQLIRIFEWVARREFPVKVLDAPYVVPFVVRCATGNRRLILLLNLSSETHDEIWLCGSAVKAAGIAGIEEVLPDKNKRPACLSLQRKGEGGILAVRKTLRPYDYLILSIRTRSKGDGG